MKSHSVFVALCFGFGLGVAPAMPDFNQDLQTYYPHAEAKLANLTTEQIASLNQFDSAYPTSMVNPNGTGLTAAELQEVDAIRAYFVVQRDPGTGIVTGRGVTGDHEGSPAQPDLSKPASFNGDFVPKVTRITELYYHCNAAQGPMVVQLYTDLIEHFLDQGYLPGGPAPWLGNGYSWRDRGWKTLRMVHKLDDTKRDLYALSIAHISGFGGISGAAPYASTDNYHTYFPTANRSVALMTDTPLKWQYMRLIRRGLDLSIIGRRGVFKSPLVPADGSVIHHDGHHTHYAGYSYAGIINTHSNWTAAGFTSDYTEETINRLRKGALAWCFATTGGLNPAHQLMRSGLIPASSVGDGGVGMGLDFVIRAARLNSIYHGTPLAEDLEMAYAAISKAGAGSTSLPVEWRSITIPSNLSRTSPLYTASLQGHYSHTTNGTSIHRGPGQWYVSVRSQNTNYRGGEAYSHMGYPDHFNRQSMWSGLEVITTGKDGRKPNEVDSGIIQEGWNYYFYPNLTTTGDVDSQADLLSAKTYAYMFGGGNVVGSANLRDSGLWMTEWGYQKSGFFLGDRIVLSATSINGSELHTGLIQHGTTSAAPPLGVNGNQNNQNGDWTLAGGGNHTLVDPQGNGYLIHPAVGTAPLRVRRGRQEWTYSSGTWLGSGTAPTYTYTADFIRDWHLWQPSAANYSRVWFDHGTNAIDQSLEYTLLVKPQPGELNQYQAAMSNPATAPVVISKNSNVHRYLDRASGTQAAAVFNPAELIGQGGMISVNRAAAYLWRRDGDLLNLSVSSSTWGSPYQVKLAGKWTVESRDDAEITVSSSGSHTVVSIPHLSEYPLNAVLRSSGDLEWEELSASADVGSNSSAFSVDLTNSGIGSAPSYSVVANDSAGLFTVQGNQIVASRSFQFSDAGTKRVILDVAESGSVIGTIVVKIDLTNNGWNSQHADADVDGFSNLFEQAQGSDPFDAASKPSSALGAYWDFDAAGQQPVELVSGTLGEFRRGAQFSPDAGGQGGGAGNRALDLGSSGSAHMFAPNLNRLNPAFASGQVTVSFWQKLDSTGSFSFFAKSPTSVSQRGLAAHAPYGSTIYFDQGGMTGANRSSIAQPAGVNWTSWNHLVFVRNGTTAEIWLNGNRLLSETGKAPLKSDFIEWTIGSGINGELGMRGDIDDFAIFTKALSPAQIGSLAAGASPLSIQIGGNQAPVISSTVFVVEDNLASGGVVGTLAASDADGPGAITWTIDGTALSDVFALNPSSGELTLVSGADLDSSLRSSYPLRVVATDGGGMSSFKDIEIKVVVPTVAPVATGFSVNVADDQPAGTVLGTATKTDPDPNQTHTWAIVGGNGGGRFVVNPNSGVVSIAASLVGSPTNQILTLRCTDSAGKSGDATVSIRVFAQSEVNVDTDADGYSNAFERYLGSDPNDASSIPDSTLAAFWSFDQTGAPASIFDQVRGVPGQPLGGAALSAAGAGRSGNAQDRALNLGTSGSGSRMEVTSLAWWNQLTAADTISISFWQKTPTIPAYGCALWATTPTVTRGLGIFTPWSDSVIYVDHSGTSGAYRTSVPNQPATNAWTHFVMVKNGGTVEIWKNGTLLKSESGKAALRSDFNKLVWGSQFNSAASLRGFLDDVAVFGSALSAGQIAALHQGTSPLDLPPVAAASAMRAESAETADSEPLAKAAVAPAAVANSGSVDAASSAEAEAADFEQLLDSVLGSGAGAADSGAEAQEVVVRGNRRHRLLSFVSRGPLADAELRYEVASSPEGPWTALDPYLKENQLSVRALGNGRFRYTVFDPVSLEESATRVIRLQTRSAP